MRKSVLELSTESPLSPAVAVADRPRVTPERLFEMAWNFSHPILIAAAVEQRVFDHLFESPKTLDQLCTTTGASRRGLRALVNALVSFELLEIDSLSRYSLTLESETFLVRKKPSFLGGYFRHLTGSILPRWLRMNDIVRLGKPVPDISEAEVSNFFVTFVEDLFPVIYPGARTLAASLDLEKYSNPASEPYRVLDLAAGSGVWGIAIAQQAARVLVTALDLPEIIPVTRRVASRFGLLDRFHFIAGSLETADFGAGFSLAMLGHILHSLGEDAARKLLKKTFTALAPGGTIAIAEFTPDEDRSGPPQTLIFAMNMTALTPQGDAFTLAEISKWLREAGFANIRTLDIPGPSPLILANKPA